MIRTRLGLLVCCCAAAMLLSACDGGGVDNDSPRGLIESTHKMFQDKDFEGLAGAFPPDHQEAAGVLMGALEDMMDASESLGEVVEKKFDAEKAKMVKSGPGDISPYAKVTKEDGSLDWSKIKIKEEGDKATVEIDGQATPDPMVKIDGKWYMGVDGGKTPEELMKEAKEMRTQADKMVKGMGELEEGIKSGKVTKDNFMQEYMKAMMGD